MRRASSELGMLDWEVPPRIELQGGWMDAQKFRIEGAWVKGEKLRTD